jgi:hypothetical protein
LENAVSSWYAAAGKKRRQQGGRGCEAMRTPA